MITGLFHEGSGLGDQLHRYITVRTFAESKGWEYQMIGKFKGHFFQPPKIGTLEEGSQVLLWNEKEVRDANGNDIRSYDPNINFIEDNTVIDGCFEDNKYWGHNLTNINEWLRVEPIQIPDDVCVIGFRGGEYATQPDLFLPLSYFLYSIGKMKEINPDMKFEVHTDDKELAQKLFPEYPIIQDMELNWRSMRYAKHAIIANSAFYIMPRQLQHHVNPESVTYAPRFWARRNTRVWSRPACFYPQFMYV